MIRSFTYWGSSLGTMRVPSHAELMAVSAHGIARWDADWLNNYLHVCPTCGEIWLRSECEGHGLAHKWAIRPRYCFEHMAEYLEAIAYWVRNRLENRIVPFVSAPGALLSFYDHAQGPVSDAHWQLWLHQLPAAARRLELRAWTELDLRINPGLRITDNVPTVNSHDAGNTSTDSSANSDALIDAVAERLSDTQFTEQYLPGPILEALALETQRTGHQSPQLRSAGSGQDLRNLDDPAGVQGPLPLY